MTEAEIVRVLQENYHNQIHDLAFLRQGGCTSYLAKKAPDSKLFVKIIGPPFISTAVQSISIQEYLLKNRFPVPGIVYTNAGHPYLERNKQILVVYEFIEASEPILDENIEKIGELAGRLHHLMSAYQDALPKRGKSFFVDRYITILQQKKYPAERVREYREIGHSLWDSVQKLPYGFCHGDFHTGNLLQTTNGTIYLSDFDTACSAPQLFDIAVVCDTTDYFHFDAKDFHHTTEILSHFMKSYTQYHPLRFSLKQFYDCIALRHFQLQATIVEIYGLDCIDEEFMDKQLSWIKQWRSQYL